jgi:hypothetical protein
VAAPTERESYRYAPDGTLADLRRSDSSGTWMRDEFIYLQGMPVAVSHTENLATTPTTYFLSPDAMGTPRRALVRNNTLWQHRRLVMDPWGNARLVTVRLVTSRPLRLFLPSWQARARRASTTGGR